MTASILTIGLFLTACFGTTSLAFAQSSVRVDAASETALPVVRVGMVFDGPWIGNVAIREVTVNEIKALTEGEFDVRFPADQTRFGDWTYESAHQAVEALLEDPAVDLVVTWGVLASHTLCCVTGSAQLGRQGSVLPKPVIAPIVLDVGLQDIPNANGTSGVPNLSYVAFPDNTANELAIFRDIVPFERVVFLAQESILDAIPELAARTSDLVAPLGVTSAYVGVGLGPAAIDRALAAIPVDTDAVYVWPQIQLSLEESARLVSGLNARKLPTFSALADASFDIGMLATMADENFFPRLARRVALNFQRILLGEDAANLPVDFAVRGRLTLNVATAHAIGVSPRWSTLIEADLTGTEALEGYVPISFDKAVVEAVDVNLDLRAQARFVAAGAQDPIRARSAFRPQVDIGVNAVGIDDDRASAAQAERTVTGSLTLSQLVFDESARAAIDVQDQLQLGREAEFEALRLDIALETAVAYLNLLRAISLAEVERSNLGLTRSNLERAEIRRSVGAANPAELFRWQSQIANDRRALIDATATIHQAEIDLNRLLDRDLETHYNAAEVDLDDPLRITARAGLDGYLETPRHLKVFSDFTVGEGLSSAPELAQLRSSITAQERQIVSSRRAFFLPQVSVQGSLDELLADEGVGSGLAGSGVPDDTSWSLALGATLPLYAGGARRADRIQAEETLSQLTLQLEATSDRLEQRIRSAMVAARASFTGIELSEEAADAARRNFELVADAYSRGAVSIIDVLDAQDAALTAEQGATNAAHDFLIDLMELQRAANQFDFFTSPAARSSWFMRLESYFQDRGVRPWPEAPADR